MRSQAAKLSKLSWVSMRASVARPAWLQPSATVIGLRRVGRLVKSMPAMRVGAGSGSGCMRRQRRRAGAAARRRSYSDARSDHRCRRKPIPMSAANPILVEAWRGPAVESAHRGAIAVVDAEGSVLAALGDVLRPVYPRSAVKVLQALPLVESGAAEQLGLEDDELALACASHRGEQAHTKVAARMLAKAGLDASALECGAHWPYDEARRARCSPRAASRARCTTTARASTPASSASPARRRRRRPPRLRARLRRPRASGDARGDGGAAGGDGFRPRRRAAGHRRLLDPDPAQADHGGARLQPRRPGHARAHRDARQLRELRRLAAHARSLGRRLRLSVRPAARRGRVARLAARVARADAALRRSRRAPRSAAPSPRSARRDRPAPSSRTAAATRRPARRRR